MCSQNDGTLGERTPLLRENENLITEDQNVGTVTAVFAVRRFHIPPKSVRDKNAEKVKCRKVGPSKLILHFMASKIVHDDRNGHNTRNIFHCGAMISSLP